MVTNKVKRFAEITKFETNEDGTLEVEGIASTETADSQGETVTKGAMEDALPDYFKFGGTGPLRAMHQPSAAGFVHKAEVNEDGQTIICATVVDPVDILKVQKGVYKGFSIGGNKVPGGYDKVTKTISKLKLTEISLVDRPANPEAVITMWKGDDMDTQVVDDGTKPGPVDSTVVVDAALVTGQQAEQVVDVTVGKAEDVANLDVLADLINKGSIAPEKLLELANIEIAKASATEVQVTEVKPEDTAPIKKGMYSIQEFASVIRSISYLVSEANYEATSEGDNSPIPKQLLEWITTGVGIFNAMAVEETAELIAQLKAQFPANVDVEVIALAQQLGDLRKSLTAEGITPDGFITIAKAYTPASEVAAILYAEGELEANMAKAVDVVVQKAGARNSKTDAATIQSMHDGAVNLGAACDVAKHGHTGDISKLATLETDLKKVQGENDTLKAELVAIKAQPAPPKAALRVTVAKVHDVVVDENSAAAKEEPIKKADGSIDQEAEAKRAIAKIHQSGGRQVSGLRR